MRSKIILLIIACLFIGMSINTPQTDDDERIVQEKLKEFEDKIIVDDNDYESSIIDINPGVVNKTGKKVENLIDKGFDFCFGRIKNLIG